MTGTPPRLSSATLAQASPRARTPAYDRSGLASSVVHIGPGAFHRAHQAVCFDDLNARDPRWGVVGVSLRSAAVAQALAPQDHLYTLVTLDAEIGFRVIGAHTAFLSARTAPREALATLTRSGTTLVTLTITEKGYGLGADGRLDLEHADIRRDLAAPRNPTSAIGWLVEALRLRRAAGAAAFDVLSCDNLPANGVKLRAAVLDLAAAHDRDLASWIAAEARFPCSMVDAITPATDGALRARVAREVGLADAWPVQREAFAAWVIEDAGASWLADLASVGAVVTTDVAGHERAKLRLLNGAHTCLAYLGLARGHATVKEAMADAELARFVAALMREEIAPSLDAPPGLDLGRYGDGIRARFANPAIRHALAQIAWDGSQKLPIRLMGTIRDNLAAGRPIDRLATGVAAWMRFVRRRARAGVEIVDPEASRLRAIGEACSDEARRDTALFLERSGVIAADLAQSPRLREALERSYDEVMRNERAAADPAGLAGAGTVVQPGE